MKKKQITNCHTHVFTGDHVPPYLAKTFLPPPFYYLINLGWVVAGFRQGNKLKDQFNFHPYTKQFRIFKNKVQIFINRFGLIKFLVSFFVTLQVVFSLYRYISYLTSASDSVYLKYFLKAQEWLLRKHMLLCNGHVWLEILLALFLVFFLPSWRNMIFFVFSKFWSFFGVFSGHHTRELIRRYLNIGRYAFHKKQLTIFSKLKGQYPQGTRFVVLPMDMEYMEAGKVKISYHDQMRELAGLKEKNADIFFPFVFADPRRMREEDTYFKYKVYKGNVQLEKCMIKDYIEDYKFSGFKIYPALGYYPFDVTLLPLWKYAADRGLPILTHCIRGTIYYRGKKKNEWNHHPVFEQSLGSERYVPLLLPEMDNYSFANNFTHPLNYLCLLDERLLRKIVAGSGDKSVQELFGYSDDQTPLLYNLSHLKICFGHFGGDDEWTKFFERDRDNYSSQLISHPTRGIQFLEDVNGAFAKGKPEFIWKSVDWYTITTSLMLQFPNIYADISYILHDERIMSLLKQTLQNEKLQTRVLYGTDFFVVRNHKSDKNMLADMMLGLTEEEFDLIARENPVHFLNITDEEEQQSGLRINDIVVT